MIHRMPVILAIVALASGTAIAVLADNGSNQQNDPAQIARGAKAWAANCGRCHNIRAPNELTDEEWDVSVTHMRVRANIPGNVADDIKAFLKSSNK